MIPYGFVQVTLWFQMLLWLYLYDKHYLDNRFFGTFFYLLGMYLTVVIAILKIQIGFFTPLILMQYVFFVLLATTVYQTRWNFTKAVSLAFLTVFLNSFYWEIFYHFYEFYRWLPGSLSLAWWGLRLPQWIRLLPAWFFGEKLSVTSLKYVNLGLFVSLLLTYIRFSLVVVSKPLHLLHRSICLILLIYTIYNAKERLVQDE